MCYSGRKFSFMLIALAAYLSGALATLGMCLSFSDMGKAEAIKLSAFSWVGFGFLVGDKLHDIEASQKR